MLMLTLDDAVKVAKRLVMDDMNDEEIIRQELEQKCWFPPEADEAAKHLNDLIFHINPFPSAQPEQQWVLVKEKLPEEDKDVLVTVHFLGLEQKRKSGWIDHIKPCYYVDIASHIDGEWSSASDEYKVARNRHIVIAWKELPDPYRGEGENG